MSVSISTARTRLTTARTDDSRSVSQTDSDSLHTDRTQETSRPNTAASSFMTARTTRETQSGADVASTDAYQEIKFPGGALWIGEADDGVPHGVGRFYRPGGELMFDGRADGGIRQEGTIHWSNGTKWTGPFKNNMPEGCGWFYAGGGDTTGRLAVYHGGKRCFFGDEAGPGAVLLLRSKGRAPQEAIVVAVPDPSTTVRTVRLPNELTMSVDIAVGAELSKSAVGVMVVPASEMKTSTGLPPANEEPVQRVAIGGDGTGPSTPYRLP